MKYLMLLALPVLCACHNDKEPDGDTKGFPALAFIQSQVRDVDTSLYRITKIVTNDGRSDTSVISREAFRKEAAPFLNLPDISSSKLRGDYTETKLYDESLQKVVLFYSAKDPDEDLQREQVLIDPDEGGGLVKTIIADLYLNKDGVSMHRNLYWQSNDYFQISENRPGPGGTEKIIRTRIMWNNFSSAQ